MIRFTSLHSFATLRAMRLVNCLAVAILWGAILSVAPLNQATAGMLGEDEDKVKVINEFLEHLKQVSDVPEALRTEATELVTAFRDDEYSRDFALTEGLAVVYPEFGQALESLASDETDQARELLQKLSGSEDQYLAADATFYLARSNVFEEDYEEALPLFDRVLTDLSDYSVQNGNALYFKGMAQGALLHRADAKATLEKFVNDYPNAPERMKISAQRRLYELSLIEDGSLYDVFERMAYSRRNLELERTGEPTQQQQDEIVKILDKLIKKVEDQESSGQGSNTNKPSQGEQEGQGKGEGQGQSQSGGGSNNPDGFARRTFGTGPQSPWSELRDRTRDPAFTAIKEKYPARYQKIIEQYYKSFQDSGN